MPLNLLSEITGQVTLSPCMPTMLWEYKLPDAKALVASGPEGQFLLQELRGTNYSVWYNTYQLPHRDTITIVDAHPVIRIPFMIRNSFHYQSKGLPDWWMHESSFAIYYNENGQTKLRFDKDRLYSSFELCITPEFLQPMAAHFPLAAALLDRACSNGAALAGSAPLVATPAMMAIIKDILNNTYTGPLRQLYLDAKVNELLLMTLHRTINYKNPAAVKLSEAEVETIYDLKAFLLKQLDRSYSVDQLAKRRGLTAHKLKRGFLRIYGAGIFEYLLVARMERAGALLHETHIPVEQIARLTGYKNMANFSVVFKKYFGFPPRYFRGK